VLCFLGVVAGRRGEYARARALLDESTAISLELGEPMYALVSMLELAPILLAEKHPEAAAQILGASIHAREAAGSAIPSFHIATQETALRGASETLGEKRFAAAYDEGERMTLEQAFAAMPPPSATREPVDAAGLTARELEVLGLVAQGSSDAEVAEALVVSRRTVHAHVRSIYRKLDVRSRSAATRYAVDHELV
jgi:ATP/maltotriose-dependent transcriptional regulator MalT